MRRVDGWRTEEYDMILLIFFRYIEKNFFHRNISNLI
jgi:hypothetical protein